MKRIGIAAVLAVAVTCPCVEPAVAELRPELRNAKVVFDYYEPRNAKLMPLYDKLQRRQVLEELSQFLAPVRWPKKLRLIMKECAPGVAGPEVYYSTVEYSLNVCYQWFAFLESLRPQPAFATRQEVIVGGLVGIVLHEGARAVFDMFNVPRLGSEDDAADQISAFIGLQFDQAAARAVIKGSYFVWKKYDDEIIGDDRQYNFAGKISVPRQRMYNTLCMGYGGAPATFKTFVDQGDLLSARAEHCEEEYQQVRHAFVKTILPHVDTNLMKLVRSITWLNAEDLK
jgi:putative metallopeptidase DUF4344